MLTVMILLALAYCFYAGARRGMWLQLVHTAGYTLSFLLAALTYRPLARVMDQWVPYPSATEQSTFVFFTHSVGLTLDAGFYNGVAFLFVLTLGFLATRFGALWVHDLTYKKTDPQLNLAVGGGLNLLVGYLFLFLLLYLLALVPVDGIQQMLDHSLVAKAIIRYTPGLTGWLTQLWIAPA